MLTPEVAKGIINEVIAAVKDWRVLANRLGIAKREMSLFEGVFDNWIKDLNNLWKKIIILNNYYGN